MNRGDAHRLEGGVETDRGHIPTGVGHAWEIGYVIHEWGVAIVHSHALVVAEGLAERSGTIDGSSWLRDLVGSLGKKLRLWGVRGI